MSIRMHRYENGRDGLAAFCDTCGEQVTAGDGWIVWDGEDITNWLVVHQVRCDPGGRGGSPYGCSMPLEAEIIYLPNRGLV